MARTLITRSNKSNRVTSETEFQNLRQQGLPVFYMTNEFLGELKQFVESEVEAMEIDIEDMVDAESNVDPQYFHRDEVIAELLGLLIELTAPEPSHTVTVVISGVLAKDEAEAERKIQREIVSYFDRKWDVQISAEED